MIMVSVVDNLVLFLWSSSLFYKDEMCIVHVHNTKRFITLGVIQLILSIKLKQKSI